MKSFRSHRKSIERTKLKEDLSDEGILENPDDLDILEHAGFVEVQSQPTVPHFVGTKSNITTEAVNYKTYDDITLNQLNDIEKYADKLFAKVGIDVEFTRHFLDRVNDARNKRQITPAELTRLFKQSYKKHGRTISKLGPAAQAVINDMRTDINMPFVLEPKGNVLELVAKTVMRKKDFKTPNTKFSFEQYIKEKHDFFEKDIYEKITLPPPPRNDYREIQKIKDAISTRTAADEESIRLHDEVPFHAIQEYCEKENLQFHIGEFEQLADQSAEVIMHFKEKFNRKRPWMVDESIRPLNSKTNKTPAYPSGHAAQSILIANYVAGKFPEHRVGLMAAAKKCGWGRVQAGWHYVSDYKVGNQLGEELYKLMNRASFFSEDALKFDEQLRGLSEDIRIESERDKIAQKEKDVIQSLIEVNEAFNETEEVVVDLIQDPFLRWQEPIEPDPNSPQDVAGHITGEGHILPEELTVVQALSEELGQLKRSLPNMMATTAGGGSVNLFDLDDVDESTRQDGYFLQYRSSDSKYIGAASAVSEETIADVVGSMVTSNTESGITVTYQDGDNTLDFTIGTLNQDTTGNAATATALETARTIHGVSFDGTANIDLTEVVQDTVGAMFSSNTETGIAVSYEDGDGTIDLVVGTLNQNTTGNAATATLATTVTVSDSTANTNFPVVFHNESNALLDDTGALRYNPSTGELLVPKLTVAGTTTQVDTVTMEASNAIVFEGATADAYETTLTVTDPTADRTITLPNVTGTVALTSSDITGNAATATALETARTIGMTGDVVWTSASFDGSGNVTGSATIQANSVDGTMIALGSDAAGDVMYYDGTNYIRLAKGSDDEVLTLASGVPSWAASGGTAALATSVTVSANNSTDETVYPVFVDGATGTQGAETDTGLTYNPSTGVLTTTSVTGNLTGNVTGNTSGTAATVTTAAQTNITSLGTLTALQVDNININGNTISSTAGTDLLITPLAGQQIVLDGTIVVDAGVVTGATSITSTAFVGALTGNVTGNVSGSSGSATGNAATATALATARTIGGTSFDGTGNIAVALSATATALASARTIGGVSFDGTANINLPGVNAAGNQNTSGTAAIATTVTITDNESTNESNAIIFTAGGDVDGGNLGLESDGTLTYNPSTGKVTATGFVGTLTGNVTGNTSGSSGSTTGNAATATALATGRTIAMTGDVTWTSASFDGSGNVTGTAAIGSGVIVDADVNASAAIAWSKMANLTASRALYSDGSGDVTVSAVTSTELGYLDGVTSALQTQLDAKGALAGMTMTGTTKHGDMVKSMWGTGDDFEIFHDQYNTYLHDTGTGAILVGTSEFQIKNAAYDETMFVATADGAVTLYHNNNARLATSGAGVTVTGTVTATAGATLLVKNSSGTTLKTIKGMS